MKQKNDNHLFFQLITSGLVPHSNIKNQLYCKICENGIAKIWEKMTSRKDRIKEH